MTASGSSSKLPAAAAAAAATGIFFSLLIPPPLAAELAPTLFLSLYRQNAWGIVWSLVAWCTQPWPCLFHVARIFDRCDGFISLVGRFISLVGRYAFQCIVSCTENHILNRVLAMYQILLDWKAYKHYYETDELPKPKANPIKNKLR